MVGMTILASAVSTLQEYKIWKHKALPTLSFYGQIKVFLFNVVWMSFCLAGAGVVVIRWVLFRTDLEKDANRLVESKVAHLIIWLFVGDVKVVGLENLPSSAEQIPAPVYIANHTSQIDAAAVYAFDRRFKWIAKASVKWIPGVGQIMALAGHVWINRQKGKNKKNVENLFHISDKAVQSGIPMFFFPQGTRALAERRPFKDGAFIVAQNNKSLLIPISIDVPLDAWNHLYPISRLWSSSRPVVKLTIHKPIPVTGSEDREALKKRSFDQIYSVLPVYSVESDKEK